MTISAKEIILTILSIIGATLFFIALQYFGFPINEDTIIVLIWGIFVITLSIIIIYQKMREVDDELKNLKNKQKKLEEDLNRAKDITNLKVDNKYLKEKILNLEKRIKKSGNKD